MPKGDTRPKTRAQQLKGSWATGPGTLKKGRGGKGADPDRVTYDSNYTPSVAQKTALGSKKGLKAKTYAAGSNILTREKRLSYDQALKKGSRADDPRNWEFHFKPPKGRGLGTNRYASGAGGKGGGTKQSAYQKARSKAKREAEMVGKDVYQVKKMEYETMTVQGETKQASLNRKAKGYGSTRAAAGVAAQKQLANRRAARGRALTTEAFEEKPKKRAGIA